MFSNKQIFDDHFTPIKSTNGTYRRIDPTTLVGTGNKKSITFNACQPSTLKRYAKDYTLSGEIVVSKATDATEGLIDIVSNLNKAMNVQVSANGTNDFSSSPAVAYYAENFTDAGSDPSFGTDYVADKRTFTKYVASPESGLKIDADKLTFRFCTKFVNPLLVGTIGGLSSLNIQIDFYDDLTSLFLNASKIGSTELRNVTLNCTEYDGGSENFTKQIQEFKVYPLSISSEVAAGATTLVNSTRIASSIAPVKVATFAALRTDKTFTVAGTYNKTLRIESMDVNINSHTPLQNTLSPQQLFARNSGYRGTFSDFSNSKSYFRYAAEPAEYINTSPLTSIMAMNIRDIGFDIGALSGAFDYTANTSFKNTTSSTIAANTYMLYTVFVNNVVISLGPQGAQIIRASSLNGVEIGDYDASYDVSDVSGAGFFDSIKKYGKKLINAAPGLIDTASKIGSIVVPNSGFTKTMGKIGNVTNTLHDAYGNAVNVF